VITYLIGVFPESTLWTSHLVYINSRRFVVGIKVFFIEVITFSGDLIDPDIYMLTGVVTLLV